MQSARTTTPGRLLGRRLAETLRRAAGDRSGVTAVEFALVAAPFFLLIFAIIETAMAIVAGIILDNAVEDFSRDVLTGQIQTEDIDAPEFRKRVCGSVSYLLSCDRLKLDMRTYPAFGNVPTDFSLQLMDVDDRGFCFDPGAADSITVLRAFYAWPWTANFLRVIAAKTNGNAILFSVSAFRNEPFGKEVSTHANCS